MLVLVNTKKYDVRELIKDLYQNERTPSQAESKLIVDALVNSIEHKQDNSSIDDIKELATDAMDSISTGIIELSGSAESTAMCSAFVNLGSEFITKKQDGYSYNAKKHILTFDKMLQVFNEATNEQEDIDENENNKTE